MNPNNNSPFSFEDFIADDTSAATGKNDFGFDLIQPVTDFSPVDEEQVVAPPDLSRIMACVCPKCAEKTDVDLAHVPENMFAIACSSCNTQIHVIRESSACRAKRKSFEIHCATCGEMLDHRAHCHSCGKPFPDFLVIVNPDEIRSKSRQEFLKKSWGAVTDFKDSISSVFERKPRNKMSGYSPTRVTSGKSTVTSGKYVLPTISLIVAIALCAGGAFAYKSYKAAQIYGENYVKALYCIKTGFDTNLKKCVANKAEWESATASGRSFSPSNNAKEETKAAKLRNEVEKYMQMMNNPSGKFVSSQTNLEEIHKIYVDTESLVQSKPKSPQELGNSIENLRNKMSQASQGLKSSLPDSLKRELETAKLKYRSLNDF